MNDNKYKLILGLEIHLHLKTLTKMFCGCNANIYGEKPNSLTCPTCLGLPGALPVPNFDAVKMTQMLGMALGCDISKSSRFDRKHYMYPDLPKGYQISQYKKPLCENGNLVLSNGNKIEIERIHLEEDTAKSIHKDNKTLIDFNKSGMPLVEIVTTPTINSVEDAVEFSKKIQDIVRSLNISNADMEKGQMRLEANISLSKDKSLPDYKVEIKNINSFRFMQKAIIAEVKRQKELLEKGETLVQENRGYDEQNNVTVPQRLKEFAHDYRYFPEPDIPPMVFDDDHIKIIKDEMLALPSEIKRHLMDEYDLSDKNATSLTTGSGLGLVSKFGLILRKIDDADKVANLLLNNLEYQKLSVDKFVDKYKGDSEMIGDESQIQGAVDKVIKNNEDVVQSYKSGKVSSIEFLLGKVMAETKGKADPKLARSLLEKSLNK